MKARLEVKLSINLDEDRDMTLNDIKNVVREYLIKGKFMINDVIIKTNLE